VGLAIEWPLHRSLVVINVKKREMKLVGMIHICVLYLLVYICSFSVMGMADLVEVFVLCRVHDRDIWYLYAGNAKVGAHRIRKSNRVRVKE
jgi:hypothetical protein